MPAIPYRLIAPVVFLLVAAVPAFCQAQDIKIARFDIDVTPPIGFPMAYDSVRKVDELGLRARGIVIVGAGKPIALCAVDWIGIGNGAHDQFREAIATAAGTSADRVTLNTLHQHDAPRCDFSAERILNDAGHVNHGALQGGFARSCLQRLKQAVTESIATAQPVTHFAIGEATVEKVASNRRIQDETGKVIATRYTTCKDPKLRALPEGIIDPVVTSISFLNGTKPVAVLTYYACHPQSYYRTGIPSPDFPGIARFLRGQDVPDCLHVHFNGAGGNIAAGKYNDGNKRNRIILAQRLADGMRRAFESAKPVPLNADSINWAVAPVQLPLGDHLKVDELKQKVAQWNSKDYWNAPEQLAFAERCQGGHKTELSCLKIGDARILHMPGELFVEYQLAAKELRPNLNVAMAAYADYGPGYIGTAKSYGQGGYETSPDASKVSPAIEKVLMDGIQQLLKATDDPPKPTEESQANSFKNELPRIPPTPPEKALSTFQIADDYAMQLVAAEPLIGTPVAIEWDASGRLLVCEMKGYSEDRDAAISTIGLLEDSDADGIYDKRTEFASGLLWPTAIFPFDGGIFVGDAPDLLYLKDTNADGIADVRNVVLTGFGTSNVQGLMNSMRWGLDNKIHIACSSTGGKLQRLGSTDSPVDIRGRDIAFDPRTGNFEMTTATAQHGMCFDDWGRKFSSANSDHIIQIMYDDRQVAANPLLSPPSAKVSIAADGPQAEVFRTSPVEPWRVVRTRLRVQGQARGPIEGGGRAAGYFTGATGVTIYRGDAWPESDKGFAIVGDVGSNLVHRKRLSGNALPFTANRIDQQSEFITSTDNWFRPSQFANGPDGCLYLVDTYREVIEHPKSLPPEIKQHLDLTAGRDRGRIYRIFPKKHSPRTIPNLASNSTSQLVGLLNHPNAWHRETAARLLNERQDKAAISQLESATTKSDFALGKLHALSVLNGMNALKEAVLLQTLTDKHPQVRRFAALLTSTNHLWPLPEFTDQAELLAADPSEEVRIQLAYGLHQIEREARTPLLATLALQSPKTKWSDLAILCSATNCEAPLFELLCNSTNQGNPLPVSILMSLATQVQQQDNTEQHLRCLKALNAVANHESPNCLPLFSVLLKSNNSQPLDQFKPAQRARHTFANLLKQTVDRALDTSVAESERISAIQHFRFAKWNEIANAMNQLLATDQPFKVRQASLQSLSSFQHPKVAQLVRQHYPTLSPTQQRNAIQTLISRTLYHPSLVEAVKAKELSDKELSISQWQQLAKSKQAEVAQAAKTVLQNLSQASRSDMVTSYRDSLNLTADTVQGKIVFQKQCSSCHRVQSVGNEIGPNLAAMKARGPEAILLNILDPNLEVNPQYLNYNVITTDGLTVSGMIESEGATSLALRQPDGTSRTMLRNDIEEITNTHKSLMPEGLERTINKQDMANLIAFLMQP